LKGRAGIIEAGADADLLVANGDPLTDWGLLEKQGAHTAAITQAGHFIKRTF